MAHANGPLEMAERWKARSRQLGEQAVLEHLATRQEPHMEQPLTVGDLATGLHWSPSRVQEVLERLEERWLVRVLPQHDGTAHVFITRSGRQRAGG